jgi:hypothetical protein
MLQPDSTLPDVPRCPAPWSLRGSGWIVALKLPPGAPARDAFLPPGLAGQGRGLASYLMYVDYLESGCGPYRELLFIPGAFPFGDGRRHLTISRILVSTWDSVVNGRDNWGIPKDRADFEVEQGLDGGREDRVRSSATGERCASCASRHFASRRRCRCTARCCLPGCARWRRASGAALTTTRPLRAAGLARPAAVVALRCRAVSGPRRRFAAGRIQDRVVPHDVPGRRRRR